jgi:hypothetical protein
MKRSLAWLWLIGAVLYAVSVWLSAEGNVADHASSSQAVATNIPPFLVTESAKPEQIVEARTEPIAPQASLRASLDPGSASEKTQKTETESDVSAFVRAERLVVRSTANIRSGPSSKSSLIGTAPIGAELDVAERKGSWVRFVDPATSHDGWLYEELLAPVAAESARPAVKQSSGAAANPKAKVRNATRTVSVKKRGSYRPYALGYAPNPSAEQFGTNKRRLGFFARRRMVREGLAGTD